MWHDVIWFLCLFSSVPGIVHINPSFCHSGTSGWLSSLHASVCYHECFSMMQLAFKAQFLWPGIPEVISSRDTVLLFRDAAFCCKGRVLINCNSSKKNHYFLIILNCRHLGLSLYSATRLLKALMTKAKTYITKLGYSLARSFLWSARDFADISRKISMAQGH